MDTKMNPTIRDQWCDALESNEFFQGQGQLRMLPEESEDLELKATLHCCLGVLTELYVRATGDDSVWSEEGAVLCRKVYTWAGMEHLDHPDNPIIVDDLDLAIIGKEDPDLMDRTCSAAGCNEIAALIRKNL